MNRVPNPLIEQMAAGLQPVSPMKLRNGLVLVVLATLATVLGVEFISGLWRGMITGEASSFFWVTNGLLLVLGLASATSTLVMVGPRVGNRHEGPKWAMAMAVILPLAALLSLLSPATETGPLVDFYDLKCMFGSIGAGLLTATALVMWLRRGAPVSLGTAGLHVGVAAGALGSVAHGLSCPIDQAMHLGIWHVIPVVVAGLIGRFVVPRLVRW